MRVLDDMCELLEDELKEVAKKGDISPTELDSVYKSVDIIKDIETIKAMKQGGYSYNSYDGSYGPMYDGSYDGMNNNGMSMEGSYGRRGRDGDGDGRYSERRRGYAREGSYDYSRNSDKESLMKEMRKLEERITKMQ